jgi:hypothetical protein
LRLREKMPRIDPVVQALTDDFDHPIDRLAGAIIALAIYDATNQVRRKTIRNNWAKENREKRVEIKSKRMNNRRKQARHWLQNHGIYWLGALNLEPEPILEANHDDKRTSCKLDIG